MDRRDRYSQTDWGAQSTGARASGDIDQGLRSYMLSVYNYMAAGMLTTAIAAWITYSSAVVETAVGIALTPFGDAIYNSPLRWVVIFAPLAMVFFLSARMGSMSHRGALTAFGIFALLMGLSLSSVFLVYTETSMTRVFLITAAMFGGLSLYGYTTKTDLSGVGTFLIMGVWGLIIASIVNLFLASSGLQLIISYAAVLLFSGLTAYDTQQIKNMYFEVRGDVAVAKKLAVNGALRLYLDFINLFIALLHIFGERR